MFPIQFIQFSAFMFFIFLLHTPVRLQALRNMHWAVAGTVRQCWWTRFLFLLNATERCFLSLPIGLYESLQFTKGIILENTFLQSSIRLIFSPLVTLRGGEVKHKRRQLHSDHLYPYFYVHLSIHIFTDAHKYICMRAYIYMAVLISRRAEVFLLIFAQLV